MVKISIIIIQYKGLIYIKLITSNINTNFNGLNQNDSKTAFLHEIQYFKFTTPPRHLSKANLENVLEGFLTFLLGFSVSLSFSCFCSYRLNVKIVSVYHDQSGVHIPKYVEFS